MDSRLSGPIREEVDPQSTRGLSAPAGRSHDTPEVATNDNGFGCGERPSDGFSCGAH
jgi:hypothetical protein